MPFSEKGLIGQLEFDGFSSEDAAYGARNCGADWKKQAEKAAKNYMDVMAFSRREMIEQLQFDGYTAEEAEAGAVAVGY